MERPTIPILYSFRRCPYAMRARLALYHCAIQYEHREVVLRSKPESLRIYSPKATVPVLVLPHSNISDTPEVIEESLDIMHWALSESPNEEWLAPYKQSEKEVMFRWIRDCDTEFKHYLDRYKYADRYPESSADSYRDKACEFIHRLDVELSHRPFLLGQKICLADMAILPFVRQFAHVDKTWFFNESFSGVQSWLKRFLESPLFLSIMNKYSAWQPDDAPLVIHRN